MRWKKPTITAAVGALLVAAACGGDGDSGSTGDDEFAEGGSTGKFIFEEGPLAEAPAEPIEGAVKGGTVNVVSDSGLNTMMPTEAYYTSTHSILENLVVRSLTQFVYDPEQKDMVLVPDLAESWEANDDNTEWTFTIREGAKYENGEPVEMEDFVTAAKLSMDRTTFPQGADYSNKFFLHGGCDPNDSEVYEGYYTTGPDYDGVEVDGNKVTYKMACPFPDMPYWGSFAALAPIPEDAINTEKKLQQYVNHPLSTGPYMFDKYVPEKELTLTRNQHWDPSTDPGRLAYPDEYVMDFDVDTAKIDNIMLEDSQPTTLTYDDVLAGTYVRMKQDSPDRLVPGAVPCTWYLAPDYRKVTELEVRQALGYAFPYEAFLKAKGETVGVTAQYTTSNVMPPGIPGREEYDLFPEIGPGESDPEKAKELLAEAGYEPGEYLVTWLYPKDDEEQVAAMEQVVKGLEEGGFSVRQVATTTEGYSDDRQNANSSLNMRFAGWCSDWPSGGSWMPPLFESTNLEAEGLGANYGVFSEEEIDQGIKEVNSMSDVQEQASAWNDLEQTMQEKYMPAIPVYYTGTSQAHGSAIEGFEIDSTVGMPNWDTIWINQ